MITDFKTLSDSELALLLKTEGKLVFEEIYNRYWKKLYFVAHKCLKSQESAEEIVQDVFLLLWAKRCTLNIDCLASYLATMTRYSVYKFLTREKHRLAYLEYNAQCSEVFTSNTEDLENKLLLEIVTNLSNQLPEKCRLVFYHNKLKDKSLTDVAKDLNISKKTAEAHLTKALKLIRGSLASSFRLLF